MAGLYLDSAEIVLKAAGQDPLDDELAFLARKTALSGVLAATELYLLTDSSPGQVNTFDALNRALTETLKVLGVVDTAATTLGGIRNSVVANIFQFAFRPSQ